MTLTSARWNKSTRPDGVSRLDFIALLSFDMIQTAVFAENQQLRLDKSLYLPVLTKWCKRYLKCARFLESIASLMATQDNQVPAAAYSFLFCIYEELYVMVNGEAANDPVIENNFYLDVPGYPEP
jgi:hypothetical protein